MRITSELFVAQMTRRVFNDGGFAAIGRKGASAAGAIFVVSRGREGAARLFVPAFQSLADESGSRRFMEEPAGDEEALTKRFERETRFDPDFWLVEIEVDDPALYLDIVAEDGGA